MLVKREETSILNVIEAEDDLCPWPRFTRRLLRKNEYNGHRNRQRTKVREGYNRAATVVDQISSFKAPLFVKPADNQVESWRLHT